MPTVTRWALRTALACAAITMVAGVLLVWPGAPSLPYPTYLHLFTVGWLTNLIFGVAHWMFPRASAERPRGDPRLAWAGWGMLNAGLALRVVGEALARPPAGGLLLASALLQLFAVWTWVVHLWPRVRER
ncbi:MAG TPA: hypothetical protein VFI13_00610 [Gemmatimonadales bacterium]|nr:hypothetical protein [Gemmatimonadales bacterium]